MRGRLLNWTGIGRAAGFALVAVLITGAAVLFQHGVRRAPPAAGGVMVRTDPLGLALAHCQSLGAAAQSDGLCEAAWAENRRRFFAPSSPPPASPTLAAAAVKPIGGR